MGSYTHLSSEERDQLGLWRTAGRSMDAISRELGRAKSTISRELRRNALPSGGYSPLHADGAYRLRRRREALVERDPNLGRFIRDRLAEGWTPEQISGWLKAGNEPRLRALGCETIYAFIYRAAQKSETLWRYLTRRHKRRRPHHARPARDRIKDRASIHDRPTAVETRGEIGHWEGDLIICKHTRPVLILHERKSRLTLAARLMGKTAAETISAMLAVFAWVDPRLHQSITFANDTSFAHHALLRTMRDMTTWFCDAYASGKKAASKTPMADYDDGCRVTSISTRSPIKTSRRSSSPPISRPVNASASRHRSRSSSPNLEKTSKSASLDAVALRSGIQGCLRHGAQAAKR